MRLANVKRPTSKLHSSRRLGHRSQSPLRPLQSSHYPRWVPSVITRSPELAYQSHVPRVLKPTFLRTTRSPRAATEHPVDPRKTRAGLEQTPKARDDRSGEKSRKALVSRVERGEGFSDTLTESNGRWRRTGGSAGEAGAFLAIELCHSGRLRRTALSRSRPPWCQQSSASREPAARARRTPGPRRTYSSPHRLPRAVADVNCRMM